MNQSVDLEKLKQHREALLLAEVAAWLHMLGKFHEDFLKGTHRLATQIPPEIPKNFPQLNQLLTEDWTGRIWAQMGVQEFQADNLSIADLITQHQNPKAPTGFQRLMQDAHGRGSASEKGALARLIPDRQGSVYLSTAFGHETIPINLQQIQNARQEFYTWLEQQLIQLRDNQAQIDWHTFRSAFLTKIRENFLVTVAETRQPINDVSLFDQTLASVVFFKAALAQNLLTGWKDPKQSEVADKYHWRILRVGIDGLQFWGQASKLTDLLGRKAAIARALDGVQWLLEEDYPLGAEIYRDENGSLFVVPDVADLLNASVGGVALQDCLQQIAQKELEEEATFALTLSDRTRNMLSFGKLISAELPPPSSNPQAVLSMWQTQKEMTDVCPVCGIRPQGYDGAGRPLNQKALNRNVCGICERRRVDRASAWAGNLQTTVWTNEVADENGRLALIVGRFGLEHWLTGETLSSIMAFEPSARYLKDTDRNNKDYRFDYGQFLSEIQQALQLSQQPVFRTPLLNNLLLPYQFVGKTFSDTYDFYVGDTDLSRAHREAHLFALSLLRQQPSPARLRRIWETTRTFWQTLLNERDKQGNPVLAPAGKRLEIIPLNRDSLDLGKFHSYELAVNHARISVVWDSSNRRFVVCENLAYFARPEQLGRPLQSYLQPGNSFALEEPAGYGAKNKKWGEITIEHVNELPDGYLPAIPVLAEPRSFMVIVPANRAMSVVNAIKTKYEREMGKVRNRLPLNVGAVFFGRRTPFFAAFDAACAMLMQPVFDEKWTVNSVNVTGHIEFENGTAWDVPTVMGDGNTKDLWYPYFQLDNAPDVTRTYQFQYNGNAWVHVKNLQKGDVVHVAPSRFDFLWLDAASRRFEISYDAQGRRPARPTRPFFLEDLDRLEEIWDCLQNLTRTQLKQTLQTIETARERWFGRDEGRQSVNDETFRQFVKDTLANAQWPTEKPWRAIEQDQRDLLITAGARGELADLAELHLEILKEKNEKE